MYHKAYLDKGELRKLLQEIKAAMFATNVCTSFTTREAYLLILVYYISAHKQDTVAQVNF